MKPIVLLALVALLCAPAGARADWTPAAITGGASVAIETLVHSEYNNGAARLEFDYNQNTGDVSRFRCVNKSAYALWGGVFEVDPATGAETQLWEGTCQAGQTVSYPISKFKLMWDTVDGGLILGNYQMRARWPAN